MGPEALPPGSSETGETETAGGRGNWGNTHTSSREGSLAPVLQKPPTGRTWPTRKPRPAKGGHPVGRQRWPAECSHFTGEKTEANSGRGRNRAWVQTQGPPLPPPPGLHLLLLGGATLQCRWFLPGPATPSAPAQPLPALHCPCPRPAQMGHVQTRLVLCTSAAAQAKTFDRTHFPAPPLPRPGASSRAPSPHLRPEATPRIPRGLSLSLPARRQLRPSEHPSHPQLSSSQKLRTSLPPTRPPRPAPLTHSLSRPFPLGQGPPRCPVATRAVFLIHPGAFALAVSSAWEALPPDVHVAFTRLLWPSSRNPLLPNKGPVDGLPWWSSGQS